MISYEDLDLRIWADGDGFVVSAQLGPQSASEPFKIDLSRSWDLWQLEERGPRETKDVGSILFNTIIQGKVHELYQQGIGSIRGDAARGLRIRIIIDSRDVRLRPLLRLPWELLFDRSADVSQLPALDPRRPIVRAIDSNEQILTPPKGPLKRVLLALANPRHSIHLNLDREVAGVEEALGRISIRPVVLHQATRCSLFESICDGGHQIVHFMGHGTFDPAIGEGVLLLEDEYGEPDPIPASIFASFFAGKPMPRLVILASCLSSEVGHDPAFGPFASVAAALVAAGLPAVIAMQTEVRDRSAIRFTERLYRRVVQGDSIEAAVSEARIALRANWAEMLDWAVPVLFVRGQAQCISETIVHGSSEPGQQSSAGIPTGSPLTIRPTTIRQRDVGIQIIGDVGQISQD